MTASDVRDTSSGAQLLLDAVKRGYPVFAYVGLITGSKKPLRPAKKAIVMLSPREARSGPKTLGNERLIVVDGRDGSRILPSSPPDCPDQQTPRSVQE